jgi:hypothetical protein
MTVTLHLPDRISDLLLRAWEDLPRVTLESLAVEGYRSGKFSRAEVGDMLGHASQWETEDFLSAHDAWPGTSLEEFRGDLSALDRLRGR